MSDQAIIAKIKSAISSGNINLARELIGKAIQNPTVEIYMLASQVALDENQKQEFIEKARGIGNKLNIIRRKSEQVFTSTWPLSIFQQEDDSYWESCGQTPGEVEIKPGNQIKVDVSKLNNEDNLAEFIDENKNDTRIIGIKLGIWITDVGLAQIGKLSRLTDLELAYCDNITDVGLAHLIKLGQLSNLDLFSCDKITDNGLANVCQLTNLTHLNLYYCDQITDAGLAQVCKLSKLKYLNLESCNQITDVGLSHMSKLKRLRNLDLGSWNQTTDAGVEWLKSKLPDVDISQMDG